MLQVFVVGSVFPLASECCCSIGCSSVSDGIAGVAGPVAAGGVALGLQGGPAAAVVAAGEVLGWLPQLEVGVDGLLLLGEEVEYGVHLSARNLVLGIAALLNIGLPPARRGFVAVVARSGGKVAAPANAAAKGFVCRHTTVAADGKPVKAMQSERG